MNNQLGDPSGGKRHALIVRQISPFLTSLVPLDGCPMFADFRVHGLKKTGDPDFLYAALNKTACAAFSKESRITCANATKLHRKSRGKPTTAFAIFRKLIRTTGPVNPSQRTGAPHLARFSRDARISCTRHQATATCAAFIEESRMKFINANKLLRKSGGVGFHRSFPLNLNSSDALKVL